VYDFGPGQLSSPAAHEASPLAPLVVGEIESNPALDSTAVLYRLAYTDAQQLRPYAQVRWSMTPAQLMRQRLREHLGQRHALLNPGDGGAQDASNPAKLPSALTLRVELEEFSQLFETPDKSVGLLRLRATLVQASTGGEKLLAQHSFVVQRPAPSANAPGGVRALTAATDAAVQEIAQWLETVLPA
jgi:cholesterol transport system auxiliary component